MIYLKPMEVQDVHQFASWGSFQDELFRDYNFDIRSPQDERAWFNWKTGSLFSHYQTIFLGDRAIGYLGFKRFYPLFRVGVLGICLGAKYVDQGLSLTLFFKDTATTREVNRAQIYAWRKGIKTLYYIRIRQQALSGTEVQGCVSCML